MIHALTRSRSASFHRRSMLKLLVIATCLYALWEPIRPVREVTADILAYTAEQVRR